MKRGLADACPLHLPALSYPFGFIHKQMNPQNLSSNDLHILPVFFADRHLTVSVHSRMAFCGAAVNIMQVSLLRIADAGILKLLKRSHQIVIAAVNAELSADDAVAERSRQCPVVSRILSLRNGILELISQG